LIAGRSLNIDLPRAAGFDSQPFLLVFGKASQRQFRRQS
jgi:hypothetical protein